MSTSVNLSDYPYRTAAIIILFTSSILLYIFVYLPKRKLFKMMSQVPGPPYTLPLGNLPMVWTNSYCNKWNRFEPVITGLAQIYKCEGLFKFHIMHNPGVIIFDHQLAEDFLKDNTNLEKPYEYQLLSNWLGKGLLINDDSVLWKHRRKLLTPTFHFRILEEFVPTINDQANILVDNLRKQEGRGSFDLSPYLFSCALDVIGETAMGKKLNCQNNENQEYFSIVHRMAEVFVERMTKPWLIPDIIFYSTAMGRETKKNLKYLHRFTRSVINERKENSIKSQMNQKSEEDMPNEERPKKRLAFLDLLLDLHLKENSLTLEDIREEVDTFMFAGHDTTACCLSWTFYLLGYYPEVQQRAQEELDDIVGNSDEINVDQIKQMTYLEAIIKESLRLYPPVPIITRKIANDLKLGKYTIPSGTSLYLSMLSMHRDPKVFADPIHFRPERFLNQQKESAFVFTPFSAGARSCIGQKFAMNELKVILAKVLSNFKIKSLVDRSDIIANNVIVSKPLDGVQIELSSRSF